MIIQDLNNILSKLSQHSSRENILEFSFAMVKWMGISPNAGNKPQLLAPQTQKLKDFLANAPQTVQPQLYRLSADNQNIRVRFAVVKKLKKEYISQLVDNDPGLTSYQASMKGIIQQPDREPYISSQPYFIHFVTTPDYDRLILIFNQGDQKRIVSFRNRLTNTQYNKIILQWQNIATKSKPEIADLLWKSLDIKEVNKEFYKQVKERFDALVGIVKSSKIEATENQVKQFAVRLIGRYIFCWFLKEKKIIPAQLIDSGAINENINNYYKKYLLHLFFNTLNTEVQNRDMNLKSENLFEHFLRIPYLNGGLFDKHKKDDLFNDIELNEWLLHFVKVLEKFDFTVDESSSNYQLVAIDPEMLGRIFENLLASQNPETEKMANQRKAFGAFYTPREIVDYMVDSSLRNYLEQKLLPNNHEEISKVEEPLVSYAGSLFQHLEPRQIMLSLDTKNTGAEQETKRKNISGKLDKLFSPTCTDNPFDKSETAIVQNALRDIKILDPACGSGAFPMGVLLRLMQLREIVGNSLSNSYELKSEILGRNIFGVDIMPMAIEIARLRAWLSLVLEADYKPNDTKHNFGIKALPNLDFKFVCANTLIESGYDTFLNKIEQSYGNPTLMRLDGEIQRLERLRNEYFDPKGDKHIKQKLRKEFNDTKNYIKTEFQSLSKTWNLEDFLSKVDDWDPFDDSKPSSFFSSGWMFGIKEGFDVVIGNPPYFSISKETSLKVLQKSYDTFESAGDIYCLFYEKGNQLLKKKGVLYYITSNKWMRANYGQKLRHYFVRKTNPIFLFDFSWFQVFESASVDSNIFAFTKDKNQNNTLAAVAGKDFDINNFKNYIQKNGFTFPFPDNGYWTVKCGNLVALKNKLSSKGKTLEDWDVKINYGIKTGLNEAFIVDEETKNDLIVKDKRNAAIIKPLIRGRNVERYCYKFEKLYLINAHNGIKELKIKPIDIPKDYPIIFQYLSKFKEKAETRADKGDNWFNLRNCAYLKEFEKEKLIWAETMRIHKTGDRNFPRFGYDNNGFYTDKTVFICVGSHIKYLLAFLNSAVGKWLIMEYVTKLDTGGYMMQKIFLDTIPIFEPNEKQEQQFIDLVDKILQFKNPTNPNQNTSALERQIDVLVYKLYELTYEEVKVIDPNFWLSQEEYKNFKVE